MKKIADVGAAVIGTGFMGTVHVEALRRIGVRVCGVLGGTPSEARLGRMRSACPVHTGHPTGPDRGIRAPRRRQT